MNVQAWRWAFFVPGAAMVLISMLVLSVAQVRSLVRMNFWRQANDRIRNADVALRCGTAVNGPGMRCVCGTFTGPAGWELRRPRAQGQQAEAKP